MKKTLEDTINKASEIVDQLNTPSTRAGSTLKRIAQMSSSGVSSKTIASQLEDNSKNGTQYSSEQIAGFNKLFADCKTKVGVTKKQAQALIKDQKSIKNKKLANNLADDL